MQSLSKNNRAKFQAKSYEWSAVVNIKPDTTMQDLEKIIKIFARKIWLSMLSNRNTQKRGLYRHRKRRKTH